MRKVLAVVSLATLVAASLAIAACVGDDPADSPAGQVAQGQLGGACFANGTCNAGLACTVVDGQAQCTSGTGEPSDAGGGTADTGTGNPGDSATPSTSCKFQTTPFPCGDPEPPTACFGDTQSCTLTGCGGSDVMWQCNSARQCGTACCISPDAGAFNPGANCAEGTLVIAAGIAQGTTCAATTACAAGETQLCQANSDCPAGQKCTPVKIVGPGARASLSGNIVAACTKM